MGVENLFGAAPDTAFHILKGEKRRKKLGRIVLAAFHRQHGGQIVNGHDIKRRWAARHPDDRIIERGGMIIDGYRIERAARITGHIGDDGQAARRSQR